MDRFEGNSSPIFEALEPRILLSGTPLPDSTEEVVEVDVSNEGAVEESSVTEIVFVDEGVEDYQVLLEGLHKNVEVVMIAADQNGIERISSVLDNRQGISAIHILSHGDSNGISLGNLKLSNDNLNQFQSEMSLWSKSMTADADILLYGCEAGLNEAFINDLAQVTKADVAASDDLTGSSEQGGDWDLEINSGEIDTETAFSIESRNNYQYVLAVDAVNDDYTVSDPTTEDTVLNVNAGSGLLSNDTGAAQVVEQSIITGNGANVTLNADGSFSYDPRNSATFNALDQGQTLNDSFNYSIIETGTEPDGLMNIQYLSTNGSNPGNNTSNWLALWNAVGGTNTTGNVVTANGTYNVVNNHSDTETVFNYPGGGNFGSNIGLATINSDGPGGGNSTTSNSNYSIRTTTFLKFDQAGTYTIALGSDDGRHIELTEASVGSAPGYSGFTSRGDQVNGSFSSGDTIIGFTGGTGHNQSVGTFTVAAGDVLKLHAFYYQGGGGHSGEISLARGSYSSFTNTSDFNLLKSGVHSVFMASTEGQLSAIETDTATITVKVTGVNDAPSATNDTNSITELADDTGTVNSVNGSFLTDGTDDSDVDDTIGSFSITQLNNSASGNDTTGAIVGNYGTLTWTPNTQGNGSYTYTLDDSNATVQALDQFSSLTETFTYTVSDNHPSNSKTDTATLTITIQGANDSLLAEHNTASVTEDTTLTANGNLISDDDGIDTNHVDGKTVDFDLDSSDFDILQVQNTASGVDTSGSIAGNYGTLTWNKETGAYSYILNNGTDGVSNIVQDLREGQQVNDVFTYTVHNNRLSGDGLMNVQYLSTSGSNPGNNTANWLGIWDAIGGTNSTGNVVTANGTYNVVNNHSDTEMVFDYNGGGNFGTNRSLNSINSDGPGGGNSSTSNSNYSIRTRTFMAFNFAGTYTIALGSDDGRRIELKEATAGSAPGFGGFTSRGDQVNGSFTAGDNVIGFSGGTGHNQSVGTFTVAAGDILELDAFFYQGGGGHSGEISIAKGSHSSFTNTTDFKLLTDGTHGIVLGSTNNFSLSEKDTANLTVTINGKNDAPVITQELGNSSTSKLGETNSTLFAKGTLTANDIDKKDTISYSVSGVNASGRIGDLSISDLLSMMRVSGQISDTVSSGILNWNFNSGSEAFDYLKTDETLTLTYTVQALDDSGAPLADTFQIQITIFGSLDPVSKGFSPTISFQIIELKNELPSTSFSSKEFRPDIAKKPMNFAAKGSDMHFEKTFLSDDALIVIKEIYNTNPETETEEVTGDKSSPEVPQQNLRVFDDQLLKPEEVDFLKDIRLKSEGTEDDNEEEEDSLSYDSTNESMYEVNKKEHRKNKLITQYDLDEQLNLGDSLMGEYDCLNIKKSS